MIPKFRRMFPRVYRLASVAALRRVIRRAESTGKQSASALGARPRRLLYVAASSLPYHISGYTTRTHEVISALRATGLDVEVMTRPGYPWDREDRLHDPIEDSTFVEGVPYRHASAPSKHRPILQYVMQAASVIEEAARRLNVSVIHAASNHENALPALVAARRLGLPFQYEMRGLWELTRVSRMAKYEHSEDFKQGLELEGLVAKEADKVFAISEQLAEFCRERWGIPADRFSLLPNCVNPSRFVVSGHTESDPFVIGYAGSLISYEGLDTLIRAIDVLVRRSSPVEVRVIGHGEAESELKQLVGELGLETRIHFLGKMPPEQARAEIKRCSIVCIPRKPFQVCAIVPPIKLVEALALAKPVIVPDLPVFRDELGNGASGWFFRSGDVDDLARVIEIALGDSVQLREKAIQARKHALGQRSWTDHVSKAIQILLG